jgi:hypothetical protein
MGIVSSVKKSRDRRGKTRKTSWTSLSSFQVVVARAKLVLRQTSPARSHMVVIGLGSRPAPSSLALPCPSPINVITSHRNKELDNWRFEDVKFEDWKFEDLKIESLGRDAAQSLLWVRTHARCRPIPATVELRYVYFWCHCLA